MIYNVYISKKNKRENIRIGLEEFKKIKTGDYIECKCTFSLKTFWIEVKEICEINGYIKGNMIKQIKLGSINAIHKGLISM